MSPDPRDALAASQFAAPVRASGLRVAVVAGCTGRLGEALLNAVLGSSVYERVYASTRMPLESSLRKLVAADIGHALPAVDDVYCLIAGQDHALSAASYFGRDDAFAEYPPKAIVDLVRGARAAGARRFALISPIEVYLQSSVFAEAVIDEAEYTVGSAGFESVVILRPTASGTAQPQGTAMQRFMHWWFRQFTHMIPSSMQPVLSSRVASMAVEALTTAGPGRRVVTAQDMQAR